MLVSFVVLVLTSIILYIVPQGRVAYWADWHLWGMTKTEWGNLHINLGFLFLFAGLLHIFYNWEPIKAYMKNRAKELRVFTPSFNVARRTDMISVVSRLIIVASLLLGLTPAFCQDFFVVKVLAVDSEKMTIEVLPLSAGKTGDTGSESGQAFIVRIAEENSLVRNGRDVGFPGCVRVGENIRLWGWISQNVENLFLATDIRGCRGGGCFDPTGVRSRLLQGRKNNEPSKKRSIDPTEGQDLDTHGFENGGHGGSGYGGGGGGGGGRR